MIQQPLVSVIMPVYNAENYIAQSLESILKQTYTHIEVLVADDGSTDGSSQIIDSFKDLRIKKYTNQVNLGYLKTCNFLFSLAQGDFIAFQDADDWSDLHRIEIIMDKLLSDPSLAYCGCNYNRISIRNKVVFRSKFPEKDEDLRKYVELKKKLAVCGATAIVRKCVYESIGGYRAFFDRYGYEHIDWFLLIEERYRYANVGAPLYNYRYIRNSFSLSYQLTDFMKFNMISIVWFLRNQRTEFGTDALQDPQKEPDLRQYLQTLEKNFWADRKTVYKKLVNRCNGAMDYNESLSIIFYGICKREINLAFSGYLLCCTVRKFIHHLYQFYIKKKYQRDAPSHSYAFVSTTV